MNFKKITQALISSMTSFLSDILLPFPSSNELNSCASWGDFRKVYAQPPNLIFSGIANKMHQVLLDCSRKLKQGEYIVEDGTFLKKIPAFLNLSLYP